MKKFKKIICGAIVFCLMLATCVGITGCFGNKDEGISKEEKALRDNALIVLEDFHKNAEYVDLFLQTASETDYDEDYLYYCERYSDRDRYIPIIKMLIKDESVKFGEFYRYFRTIQNTKIELNMSVNVSDEHIEFITISYFYEISDNESVLTEIDKECAIFKYKDDKAVSYILYGIETDDEYIYKNGTKYIESTMTGRVFDSVEDFSLDIENHIEVRNYDYFAGSKDNMEHIRHDNNSLDDIGLIYFNKLIGEVEQKLESKTCGEKYEPVSSEIKEYMDVEFT